MILCLHHVYSVLRHVRVLVVEFANQVVIIHVSLPVKALALQVVKMVTDSQLREDSFKQYDSIEYNKFLQKKRNYAIHISIKKYEIKV